LELTLKSLTESQKQQFDAEGYIIIKALFSPSDLISIEDTFEQISQKPVPGYF
jgi:hypothetical protein